GRAGAGRCGGHHGPAGGSPCPAPPCQAARSGDRVGDGSWPAGRRRGALQSRRDDGDPVQRASGGRPGRPCLCRRAGYAAGGAGGGTRCGAAGPVPAAGAAVGRDRAAGSGAGRPGDPRGGEGSGDAGGVLHHGDDAM
ncbi:MAG: Alpha-D-ribose 1-methylphosphonate 5-triphosphate synthase subunit PhnG, partial [uncultured Craurococcus sp.]